jgi:hypothetical protein
MSSKSLHDGHVLKIFAVTWKRPMQLQNNEAAGSSCAPMLTSSYPLYAFLRAFLLTYCILY